MICPKCKAGKLDYKQFLLYPQVECKNCRYFIHIKDLNEDDKSRINKPNGPND